MPGSKEGWISKKMVQRECVLIPQLAENAAPHRSFYRLLHHKGVEPQAIKQYIYADCKQASITWSSRTLPSLTLKASKIKAGWA